MIDRTLDVVGVLPLLSVILSYAGLILLLLSLIFLSGFSSVSSVCTALYHFSGLCRFLSSFPCVKWSLKRPRPPPLYHFTCLGFILNRTWVLLQPNTVCSFPPYSSSQLPHLWLFSFSVCRGASPLDHCDRLSSVVLLRCSKLLTLSG